MGGAEQRGRLPDAVTVLGYAHNQAAGSVGDGFADQDLADGGASGYLHLQINLSSTATM